MQKNGTNAGIAVVSLDPQAAAEVWSGRDGTLRVPFEGVSGAGLLTLEALSGNPTGVTQGLALTSFCNISLSEGVTLTTPTAVRLYYPDTNNDGIVDGLGVVESALSIYRFNGMQWVPLQDTIRSPDENGVEGTTGRFSGFAVGRFAGGGDGDGGARDDDGICFAGSGLRARCTADILILVGIGALLLMQFVMCQRCRTI